MSAGLFRKEVLLARRGERLGTISLQAPRLGWAFFAIGLLTVVAALVLLTKGHYTRHEQVTGTLVPSSGLLAVVPFASGTVTRVLVREGDEVRKGQPLLEISSAQESASLGNTQGAIAAQLQVKRARLQADLDEQSHLADLQQKELLARLSMLHEQLTQLKQQIALQQQRADSALALSKQWSGAASSGIVSKIQVLQQHDTALQNLAQLKELKRQSFQLQQQAVQIQGQLDRLPATIASKQNDIKRQLADVEQSMVRNATQSAVILQAPVDGTIANVLAHSGQGVAAQQPLMTVLPAGSTLLAELWVPSQAIGFVHTGQPVVMRYRAYPYQKFGQHTGHITSVSRSSLSPDQVSQLVGHEVTQPRYRVEVALDSQQVLAYGQPEALRPGMALDADVLLDRRSLLEWVFEPLYGYTTGWRADLSSAGRETR